jgi:hypothetical protein
VLLDIRTRGGPGTVERFAYAWYGPPRAATSPDEPPDVPEPLRRFYDVAARWPNLIVQNSLLRPANREGGRLVFYVENQGACSWMTSGTRADDAPVWAELTEGETVIEDEPLSRFLVTVAILEAVFGSPEGASAAWLDRDRVSAGLGPLRRLPFSPWRGFPEGATFYATDDLLGVSCVNATPESDDYVSVWIGARDKAALSDLDSVIDENWEYDSRRAS